MPDLAQGRAAANAVDELMTQAALQAAESEASAAAFAAKVQVLAETSNHIAHFGILPLGFALLILHEEYSAMTQGRDFRVAYVLLRLAVIAGMLMHYPFIVRLITSVAGGGDWGTADTYLGWTKKARGLVVGKVTGWKAIVLGFVTAIFVGIMVLCSLFAFIMAFLLSTVQAVLISIALGLGQLCIAVSIVPGVGIGKAWARFLAMVSAWSLIAGILTKKIVVQPHSVYAAIGANDYVSGFAMCGKFVVLAFMFAATPMITAAIFNGVGGMAPGVLNTFRIAKMGALSIGQRFGGASMAAGGALAKVGYGAGKKAAGTGAAAVGAAAGKLSKRPHKTKRPGPGVGGAAGPKSSTTPDANQGARPKPGASASTGAQTPPPVNIPEGTPGGQRWHERAPSSERMAHSARSVPGAVVSGTPQSNAAMQRRAAAHRQTLQSAYPNQSFDPESLTAKERGIMAELDRSSGRFAGWERGHQGRGDFQEAGRLADRRAQSATWSPEYRAPAEVSEASVVRAHDAHRVYEANGSGGPQVGDVVFPNQDGSRPDSKSVVPDRLVRAEAPEGVEGDHRGNVEYWTWRGSGDGAGAQAAGKQAEVSRWRAQRDKVLPSQQAAGQWQAYGGASPAQPERPMPRPHKHVIRRAPKADGAPSSGAPATRVDIPRNLSTVSTDNSQEPQQ